VKVRGASSARALGSYLARMAPGHRGDWEGAHCSRVSCACTVEAFARAPSSSSESGLIGLSVAALALMFSTAAVLLGGLVGALPAGLASGLVATAGISLRRRRMRIRRQLRTVVVGSSAARDTLERELAFAGIDRYVLVGWISYGDDTPDNPDALGRLEDLRDVVVHHAIDLVLMTPEVSRGAVFDVMARSCDDLPVRLWDLSGFYEDTFGYVPLAEINTAWFQYILHPRYRPPSAVVKRSFDIVFAVGVGVVALPVLLVLGALIRRDGGPALFRQTRIGETGRQFTIYKLRTMTVGQDAEARWSSADDPRVTRLGQWLRRRHLDELPQLWNILRGEMTVIGPRPEQPAFVRQLEREFPFYHRRHRLRPGLTGWAQARCGYAGSCDETAWKLSHDLYYLKYRSHRLDLLILFETARLIVSGKQYGQARSVRFVTGPPVAPPVLDPGLAELGPTGVQ
jgi:exopolysaccharide biosynthesis polyprenyl glycosylphosphotransferase